MNEKTAPFEANDGLILHRKKLESNAGCNEMAAIRCRFNDSADALTNLQEDPSCLYNRGKTSYA
jgi:hypothetical protein